MLITISPIGTIKIQNESRSTILYSPIVISNKGFLSKLYVAKDLESINCDFYVFGERLQKSDSEACVRLSQTFKPWCYLHLGARKYVCVCV